MTDAEFTTKLIAARPTLARVATRYASGRADIEDLVQDALCKGWEARGSFTRGSNVEAWLIVILRHRAFSLNRRARNRFVQFVSLESIQPDFEILAGPDEQRARDALLHTIRNLSMLSRPLQETVIYGARGEPGKETAVVMGVCAGTQKSRLSRARKMLVEMA